MKMETIEQLTADIELLQYAINMQYSVRKDALDAIVGRHRAALTELDELRAAKQTWWEKFITSQTEIRRTNQTLEIVLHGRNVALNRCQGLIRELEGCYATIAEVTGERDRAQRRLDEIRRQELAMPGTTEAQRHTRELQKMLPNLQRREKEHIEHINDLEEKNRKLRQQLIERAKVAALDDTGSIYS